MPYDPIVTEAHLTVHQTEDLLHGNVLITLRNRGVEANACKLVVPSPKSPKEVFHYGEELTVIIIRRR